jgi:hypothetical protein
MELIQAIALLCNIHTGCITKYGTAYCEKIIVECHRSYLHCVSKKRSEIDEKQALERCIMEK